MSKKRILCYGDSNTWGYDGEHAARFPEDVRWTGRLQALLGDSCTVIEEGYNGRTTVWDDPVENRLAGITYLWPCMDSHSPFDLIIIMLGTNDCKMYFNTPAKAIAEGVSRLVRMVQQSTFGPNGTAPEVLLVAPLEIEKNDVFGYLFDDAAIEKSRQFTEEYRAVAQQYSCHFLSAAELARPGKADGVHFDAEGHEKLAKALYEKIRAILHC